jgi:hypothetical protein
MPRRVNLAVLVLLLMVGFAGVRVPSAAATTLRESSRCGEVTFAYSAARVHPGDAMDVELTVDNCSRSAITSGRPAAHPNVRSSPPAAVNDFGLVANLFAPLRFGYQLIPEAGHEPWWRKSPR